MMKSSRWFSLLALALAIPACDDDPPAKEDDAKTEADAGAEPSLVDPKLQKALQGAPTAAPSAATGPPPGGIFAPGQADEAHPVDAPPTIEVIDQGSEPRVSLRPPLDLKKAQTIRLLVAEKQPQGPPIPIVYTLRLSQPGAGEEKGAKKDEETAEPPSEGPEPLVVTIEGLDIAQQQAGAVPPQLKEIFAQAKGSSIATKVLPSGALQGAEVRYSEKLKEEGVKQFVDNAAEALGLFFAAYPSEPIGKGGYWIASDRSTMKKLELVRYRVTKVEELKGEEVVLSVDLRQYLAGGDVSALLRGQNQDLAAAGFDSAGKGELVRKTAALVPVTGQLKASFNLQLASAQNPQKQAQAQIELQVQLLPPLQEKK